MPQPQSPRKAPPRTMIYAVGLAIAGLVAFGASLLQRTSTPSPQETSAPSAPAPATPSPVEKIHFDAGSAALPAQAADVLVRVAEAARARGVSVHISTFHDSADRERDAALASQRAQAVAHALEANGVARDRLIIGNPEPSVAGTDPREARRIEIRLQ